MAQVGLKNLYYAKMESDTASGTTYASPVKLGNAISVDLNPTVNRGQLYGDDMAVAANTSLGEITVTIETTDIPLKDKAILLGHTYDSETSTLTATGSDSAPYVALLFESEKHDGGTRCIKLYKGKFALTQETINTRGENIEYQTPSIEGIFVTRESDGKWKTERDFAEGSDTSSWYTTV